jgi:hypothetical protein
METITLTELREILTQVSFLGFHFMAKKMRTYFDETV